jgi:hypothetical protein
VNLTSDFAERERWRFRFLRARRVTPLHDSRKAAGESEMQGLSGAGQSRPPHGARRASAPGGGPNQVQYES